MNVVCKANLLDMFLAGVRPAPAPQLTRRCVTAVHLLCLRCPAQCSSVAEAILLKILIASVSVFRPHLGCVLGSVSLLGFYSFRL